MDILVVIIGIIGFAFTIIIHEVSHGLVAERLGDPTARIKGRLTFNPIPHIDILGSIVFPLTLLIMRSPFLFGWAKPVPVDPYNLRNPKKDMAIISLAGPLANILMAIILSLFLRILIAQFPNTGLFVLFYYLINFNIALAIFNLIPIGFLDGGKVLAGLLPQKQSVIFENIMERFGLILTFLLVFPLFGGNSLASIIISPVVGFFLKILIPGYHLI